MVISDAYAGTDDSLAFLVEIPGGKGEPNTDETVGPSRPIPVHTIQQLSHCRVRDGPLINSKDSSFNKFMLRRAVCPGGHDGTERQVPFAESPLATQE